MFSSRLILTLLLSILSMTAQATLEFDARYPLYTSDGTKYGFDQIHLALDKAFSFHQPVVIHIHGRGDEPLKSIDGKPFIGGATVPKIEKDYNVRVLLFNWDAHGFLFDRQKPLSHIPQAVESFKKVIENIKNYDLKGKKLILHAHSMGSIVVQNYILQNGWVTEGKSLFSNVLFTEPDADNLNHSNWMDQIAKIENVFITINNDDGVLDRSTDARPPGVKALGLFPTEYLSKFSNYIDFTKLGDKENKITRAHEIFDKDEMKYQTHVCAVMQQIMTGQAPVLTDVDMDSLRSNYMKFKFEINKNDSCFKKNN